MLEDDDKLKNFRKVQEILVSFGQDVLELYVTGEIPSQGRNLVPHHYPLTVNGTEYLIIPWWL